MVTPEMVKEAAAGLQRAKELVDEFVPVDGETYGPGLQAEIMAQLARVEALVNEHQEGNQTCNPKH